MDAVLAQGVEAGGHARGTTTLSVPLPAIVAATAEDASCTRMSDIGWFDAPHRVLRDRAVREREAAGSLPIGSRAGEGDVIG